jgi:RimJ/RimL family protein N-acetyltransferase
MQDSPSAKREENAQDAEQVWSEDVGRVRIPSRPLMEPAGYSAVETLRDGRRLEVRALRPEDRAGLLAAVDRTSDESLYRRFFSAKRRFTERETTYFVNVDFETHVALVAVVHEDGRPVIVGGGRYIVVERETAEVAFAVVDDYQGHGVGSALMRHLIRIASGAGLRHFVAEVLARNTAMLTVFERCGGAMRTKLESGVLHVEVDLPR